LAQPWEIREFRIDVNNDGFLRQVTVKQTPDIKFNKESTIGTFINNNEAAILGERHNVPVRLMLQAKSTEFMGGASPTDPNTAWNTDNGTPINEPNDARHLFSIATCSGCHAAETFPKFKPDDLEKNQRPPHFTHVRPRQAGVEAKLSDFLMGEGENFDNDFDLPDPVSGTNRYFGDLARRADDLHDLVIYGRYYEFHRLPLEFEH
jgi:hypothetical protein